MPALHDAQKSMAHALAQGPDAVPDALFTSDRTRTVTGFRVHANTISHARLIALEESFPITRKRLGETAFNHQSRTFLDAGHGLDEFLAQIGRSFPAWLDASGQDHSTVLMAQFERAWLEVYHAADAPALSLPTIAELTETGLLDLQVTRHPAVHIVRADAALCSELDVAATEWLLLTRPEEALRVYPASLLETHLLESATTPVSLGALLGFAAQHGSEADTLASLTHLIDRGALYQKENLPC